MATSMRGNPFWIFDFEFSWIIFLKQTQGFQLHFLLPLSLPVAHPKPHFLEIPTDRRELGAILEGPHLNAPAVPPAGRSFLPSVPDPAADHKPIHGLPAVGYRFGLVRTSCL